MPVLRAYLTKSGLRVFGFCPAGSTQRDFFKISPCFPANTASFAEGSRLPLAGTVGHSQSRVDAIRWQNSRPRIRQGPAGEVGCVCGIVHLDA